MTQGGATEPPPSKGPEPAAPTPEAPVNGGNGAGAGPPPMVTLSTIPRLLQVCFDDFLDLLPFFMCLGSASDASTSAEGWLYAWYE